MLLKMQILMVLKVSKPHKPANRDIVCVRWYGLFYGRQADVAKKTYLFYLVNCRHVLARDQKFSMEVAFPIQFLKI